MSAKMSRVNYHNENMAAYVDFSRMHCEYQTETTEKTKKTNL